jgi:pimeloyl-ACP methyl ester carboxylesterase
VTKAIEERGLRDVVLVGHSNAGTIIPQAATRVRERLKRLVFVSAAIPPEGKTIQQVFTEMKYSPSRPGVPVQENYRRMFCNDMDDQAAQRVLRQITPEPAKALTEPVSRPGFPKDLPLTYVLLKRDEALTPAVQRVMAASLNISDIPELDAGHDAMVSYPRELAQVLLRYA